jgi:hypothetical protein
MKGGEHRSIFGREIKQSEADAEKLQGTSFLTL